MDKKLKRVTAEMFFAFRVHNYLSVLNRKIGSKSLNYGYSLRYGKYAVVYASVLAINKHFLENLINLTFENIEGYIEKNLKRILNNWKKFEEYANKKKGNLSYFNPKENLTDYDTYYKGTTLKKDLEIYFKQKHKK
jgi:hypothetical protein